MKFGTKLVEQVKADGTIVHDKDCSLSQNEIQNIVKAYFPNVKVLPSNIILSEYYGKTFSIRIKNITYLGNPHPIFKKRIQISDDLQAFYKYSIDNNFIPLLLGIYTYQENILFCDFNVDDYINGKAHNSSAHVYTSDLQEATMYRFFQKTDFFGNTITAFGRYGIKTFLEEKIKPDNWSQKILVSDFVEQTDHINEIRLRDIENFTMSFFDIINKNWFGIDCYKQMITSNYRNKYQPEWAGFYLEYIFEKYIERQDAKNIVYFAQDKTVTGIDLDLFFPGISAYGDLKAHSITSRGIQGNDWDTVFDILNGYEYSRHIYYIICQHDTKKDSDFNYEVTKFWNVSQGKSNLMSYSSKMKHDVTLLSAHILDINMF